MSARLTDSSFLNCNLWIIVLRSHLLYHCSFMNIVSNCAERTHHMIRNKPIIIIIIIIIIKKARREQTKPEHLIFSWTKHDPAISWESGSRILVFTRSRKHGCIPLVPHIHWRCHMPIFKSVCAL